MAAAFTSVSDRIFATEMAGEPLAPQHAMAILDQVLEFLRGGLEALQGEG